MIAAAAVVALGTIPAYTDATKWGVGAKFAFAFVLFMLAFGTVYTQVYTPQLRLNRENQQALFNLVLTAFEDKYRTYAQSASPIRMNIQKCTHASRYPWKRALRVRYTRGVYSAEEERLVYYEGDGCCGKALADNAPKGFDRTAGNLDLIKIPPVHDAITRDVTSVLSIPIYSDQDKDKRHPVGILNLDSTDPFERTKFYDKKVIDLAIETTKSIGIILR